jgi:hypothetical protein
MYRWPVILLLIVALTLAGCRSASHVEPTANASPYAGYELEPPPATGPLKKLDPHNSFRNACYKTLFVTGVIVTLGGLLVLDAYLDGALSEDPDWWSPN